MTTSNPANDIYRTVTVDDGHGNTKPLDRVSFILYTTNEAISAMNRVNVHGYDNSIALAEATAAYRTALIKAVGQDFDDQYDLQNGAGE